MLNDIYAGFARFYQVFVGEKANDLSFYLEFTKNIKTPVLDAGVGSGRLTVPLAKAGVAVVALDVSQSMLAILKRRLSRESLEVQKRVETVNADISDFKLNRKFDLIIVPFFTFNYLLTPAKQNAALTCLRNHLSDSGRILIELGLPLTRIKNCPTEADYRGEKVDPETGENIKGWYYYAINVDKKIETRRHVFEIQHKNGKVTTEEYKTDRRFFYPDELEVLFSRNQLWIDDVFTGYDLGKPNAATEQFIYVLKCR
ncbi:MAG: class I SAM-dependent methyltransferase [Chloroflexi bacterium]|nr:class I SAM-dependent methyltransferase [Chloroflexota bacterium]